MYAHHDYSKVLRTLASDGSASDRYCAAAIEGLMSTLEVLGIKVLHKSTSGPLQAKYRNRLPVDTSTGPVHYVHQCTLNALQIACGLYGMKDRERAERWLKVAAWSKLSFSGKNGTLC